MSDKMRWRYGDTNPVVAAVDFGTVIEIGDLVWQDVDDAKPVSMISEHAGAIEFQGMMNPKMERVVEADPAEFFTDHFLGVAMQRSHNGDTTPLRVATTGVFGFDCCPSITCELGDLIGVGEKVDGNALANQQVVKVSDGRYAIGRAAKREPKPVTEVLVDIRSAVMGVF